MMRLFLFNLFLAVLVGLVFGSVVAGVAGFAVAAILISAMAPQLKTERTSHGKGQGRASAPPRYGVRLFRIGRLGLVFLRDLALSAIRVARLALSPRLAFRPGIFAYHLRVERDFEIALLANLITLTPGTLSVDISADRRVLFVHAVDCPDVEAARADIRNGFERLILEAFE